MRKNINKLMFSKLKKRDNHLVNKLIIKSYVKKIDISNAGGSSLISEEYSISMFKNLGFELRHDERQLEYDWDNINTRKIGIDFTCIKNNKIYAVSCTRIFLYNKNIIPNYIETQIKKKEILEDMIEKIKQKGEKLGTDYLQDYREKLGLKVKKIEHMINNPKNKTELTEIDIYALLSKKIHDIHYVQNFIKEKWFHCYLHVYCKDNDTYHKITKVWNQCQSLISSLWKNNNPLTLLITISDSNILYNNIKHLKLN